MIDKTVPAEYQKALAKIERKEEVKQKHRIIQAKLKKPHTQLTYVVQADGTTAVDQEMVKPLVNPIYQHNSIHFQQVCTNGASAASDSPFANSLHPLCTSEQDINKNMEELLSGMFNKNQIYPLLSRSIYKGTVYMFMMNMI